MYNYYSAGEYIFSLLTLILDLNLRGKRGGVHMLPIERNREKHGSRLERGSSMPSPLAIHFWILVMSVLLVGNKQYNYRCTDCGPSALFCESCCIAEHSHSRQLHIPERWTDGYFSHAPLLNVEIRTSHNCAAVFRERLTVVSLKG